MFERERERESRKREKSQTLHNVNVIIAQYFAYYFSFCLIFLNRITNTHTKSLNREKI